MNTGAAKSPMTMQSAYKCQSWLDRDIAAMAPIVTTEHTVSSARISIFCISAPERNAEMVMPIEQNIIDIASNPTLTLSSPLIAGKSCPIEI